MFASPGDTVIPWRLMPGSTPWPPPRRRASEVRLSLEPSGGWASNPSGRTRLSLLARIGSLSSYVHGSNDALGPAGPYRHQGLARAPGGRRGRLGIGSQSRQSLQVMIAAGRAALAPAVIWPTSPGPASPFPSPAWRQQQQPPSHSRPGPPHTVTRRRGAYEAGPGRLSGPADPSRRHRRPPGCRHRPAPPAP